ncbi:unnamed protein product, partial [marine sediment metagenome]
YRIFNWRGLLIMTMTGLMLLSSAYVFSSPVHERINEIYNGYHQHQQGKSFNPIGIRLVMLKNGLHLASKKPFLGYGVGGIQTMYGALPKDSALLTKIKYVEITYLNIALQLGIVGLMLFAYFFWSTLKTSRSLDPEAAFVVQACILLYLIGAVANPWFHTISMKHFLSLMLLCNFGLRQPQLARSALFQPQTVTTI